MTERWEPWVMRRRLLVGLRLAVLAGALLKAPGPPPR
ncbi:MAG: hypothetical protein QOE59_5360 [Actinomycetota bacterium]|nr:hypothetical protein [Actinomycetota bacterium]